MSRYSPHRTRRGVTIAAIAALFIAPAVASAGPNSRTSVDVHVSVNSKNNNKPNHNGNHGHHGHARPSHGYLSAKERLRYFDKQDRRDERRERYEDCDPYLYDYVGAPYPAPVYGEPVYAAPAYPAPVYGTPAYGAPVYAAPVACETPAPYAGTPVYAAPVYAAPAPVYAAPARYPPQRININVNVDSRRDRYLAPRRYRAW